MKVDTSKLDFVYILGTGSRWYDNELRYSMRSLEKYAPHRRVVIVGEKPAFLSASVVHIPAADDQVWKIQNAVSKLRIACQTEGISEDFVLMNDDFFFLREFDYKPYHNKTLQYLHDYHSTKAGYYYEAIKTTLKLLKSLGIDEPLNFEHHRPIVFNKKKFLDMINNLDWRVNLYLFRSIYGNLYGLKSTDKRDCKIFEASQLHLYVNADIISTDNPVVVSKKFRKWLASTFPKKSQYENNKQILPIISAK